MKVHAERLAEASVDVLRHAEAAAELQSDESVDQAPQAPVEEMAVALRGPVIRR
jgi:hypothetical protein